MGPRYSLLPRPPRARSLARLVAHKGQRPHRHSLRARTIETDGFNRNRAARSRSDCPTTMPTRLRSNQLESPKRRSPMEPLYEALRLIKRQTELESAMRRPGGIRV